MLAKTAINDDDYDHQKDTCISSSSTNDSLNYDDKDYPDISNVMCSLSIDDDNHDLGLQLDNMEKHLLSKQILKYKQQRLLLLRHSYCCKHNSTHHQSHSHGHDVTDDDKDDCPVTRHCKTMKLLWHHMFRCVDHQCKISHCLSSRKILSHYKSCMDNFCLICRPVRHMIAKSNSDL